MKVLELFAGIGAASKALERLGIDFEIVDAVEIDKYAIKSFNAIHGTNFEPQDICEWDKSINVDLIIHGSPCVDFSVSGKQAGGDKNSGTRSSLMWETIRIVDKLRPKYVIWENVKNILSEKHKHNFDAYIEEMAKLGYDSYYQVLNAKDYGIPQSRDRVFTISIKRGGHILMDYYGEINTDYDNTTQTFSFPPKQELKLRLKDILEDEVEEKYYLSEEQVAKIKNNDWYKKHPRIQDKQYSDTLLARDYKEPKCVEVERLGRVFDTDKSRHQAGSVYNENGLAPTLDTMQGGWRQPCIIASRGRYNKDGTTSQHFELNDSGCSNTITTVQKDNYVIGDNLKRVETYPSIIQRVGDRGKNNFTVNDKTSYTIPANPMSDRGQMLIDNELRVRKLTPKECWRLMGFDDEDFEKAKKVNSNTQLYKQAGNSIVVNVLEAIFKQLLKGE